MLLKNKLSQVRMSDSNTMTNYLMKIIELRDWRFSIRMNREDEELMHIALHGFSLV
jgi:hypothetical protein